MFRRHFCLCFLVVLNLICENVSQETVEIEIDDGTVLGQVNTTVRHGATFYSFRGIPYAKPPEGDLRFRNPERNSPWNGTYDATYDRSQCPQYGSDDLLATNLLGEEDCLYINVYTPDYNASDLPVLVWIHGGAFIGGNGSYASYGPDYFLEQNLVFVSLNYRLGILGFLSTEDEACPGNWGIKDQILALNWVQENVAYFGGNPNNVTIFGESAGSVSVHLLLQTNLTEGLFQQAIMCSGTTLNLWALSTRAETTANLIGVNLGLGTSNSTELIENLREMDLDKLMNVGWLTSWALFLTDGLRGLPFAPVIEPDIEGAVYVNPSDVALQEGNFHQIPILMGFNSEEAVSAGDVTFLINFYLTYYDVAVGLLTPWSLTQDDTKRFFAGYDIKYEYFKYSTIALDRQKLIKFVSADQFNRPIRRAATDMSNHTTVYFYEFGYQGNVSVDDERTYEGTGHAEDIDYYFKADNYSATDYEVSEKFVLLLSNFVKYGNPTPEEDETLDNIIWESIDPSADLIYLSFNETLQLGTNPKEDDWKYYNRLWDRYGDIEETTTY